MVDGLELMDKLRVARKAKNLSYQDIVDITEANGEPVSPSTVRRIFQDEARIEDFRYHQTVRPIIRAVLGMDEETEKPAAKPSSEQAEQYYATIEGLKAVVDMKGEQINAIQKENDRLVSELSDLKVDRKEQLSEIKADYQKKIDYLKDVADTRQKNIEWYKKSLGWHKTVIVVLGVIVVLAVAALIVDLSAGGVGWIRY